MIYPQISGEPNFILIGISAVFGLLVVIIVYYIVVSRSNYPNRLYPYSNQYPSAKPLNSNVNTTNVGTGGMMGVSGNSVNKTVNINDGGSGYYASANPIASSEPKSTSSNPNIKQVFNVRQNIYSMDDAPAVCGALGAEIASLNQLIDAHKRGADWCNVGWTKDGIAAYPIQYSTWKTLQDNEPNKRDICGQPGINIVRSDPDLLYGVNCYGVKPEPKGTEKIKQTLLSDSQIALNAKIAQFRKNMNSIGISPWNQDKWSA
jgi:hypothetical protein